MKTLLCLIFTLTFFTSYSQPNCEAFRFYFKDTLKYEACIKTEEIAGHYQFSKAYQEILDEAIKIDPTFAYSYRKKSTAYLKSGDFITWKKLMDQAVKYNPQSNLEYRGLMRFKCFRDYQGALRDFQRIADLGLNTDYLVIEKALCYNALGNTEKSIEILEQQLDKDDDFLGLLGYLHLGVFYLEQHQYKKAIRMFSKQSEINEIAENQFYLALSFKSLHMKSEYISHLEEAKKLYLSETRMRDVYIDPIHKIYLDHIENELQMAYR